VRCAYYILFLLVAGISCRPSGEFGKSGSNEVYLDLPDTVTRYYQGNGSNILQLNKQAGLGRVLFYDKHLSINNAIACASCHKQEFAFSDNRSFSSGYENRLTGRNTLPIQDPGAFGILITQGNGNLFWDGREYTLKNMVLRPVANHIEMGTDLNALPAKLAQLSYYPELFKAVYGTETISLDNISRALTSFISSISVNHTKHDQYLAGKVALTALELEGMSLFENKYKCNNCHGRISQGYNGADFIDIGLDKNPVDPGRYTVTHHDTDKGKFRRPSIDNVAVTAPYMHDGRFNTLDEVLEFYSNGILESPNLDTRLKNTNGKPMRMSITEHDKKAIIAFLNTLTDYDILTNPKYSSPFKQR
jgi:cytochrome c peroxidase